MIALPTGADVAAYLGNPDDEELTALANTRVGSVATFVRSHTRGVGFGTGEADAVTCAEDIAAVITSATAREVNASPGVLREEVGGYVVLYDGSAYGFTLRELTTLNAYRRRVT